MLKRLLIKIHLWSLRRDLNAARDYEADCRHRAAEIAREVLPKIERKVRRAEIDLLLSERNYG